DPLVPTPVVGVRLPDVAECIKVVDVADEGRCLRIDASREVELTLPHPRAFLVRADQVMEGSPLEMRPIRVGVLTNEIDTHARTVIVDTQGVATYFASVAHRQPHRMWV